MATQLQLRRGTEAENDAFTGVQGEVTVDTTNNHLRVHDGTTSGGYKVANIGDEASKDLDNLTTTGKANISALGTYDEDETYALGTVGEKLAKSANTDLDNLTETGANIANWSSNVSNGITEISQDIKLTLSSGTLTLLSGSKLYLPNGVGVFDDYLTTQNYNVTQASNGTYLVFFNGSSLVSRDINKCFSGTEPTPVQTYSVWYDTANNLIKYTGSSTTWQTGMYLPIALVTVSEGAISSIDQVFNGFGYIGSTIFALPGVSGLTANGQNNDGTWRSEAFTLTSVKILNISPYTTIGCPLVLNASDLTYQTSYFEQETNPGTTYSFWYKPNTNYLYQSVSTASFTATNAAVVGKFDRTSGVVSNLRIKQAFRAVGYSDTVFIGHQAYPSDKTYNPTMPAHGNNIIAPADGWFVMGYNNDSEADKMIGLHNLSNDITDQIRTTNANAVYLVAVPASKGQVVQVFRYTATPTVFKFVYANSVK